MKTFSFIAAVAMVAFCMSDVMAQCGCSSVAAPVSYNAPVVSGCGSCNTMSYAAPVSMGCGSCGQVAAPVSYNAPVSMGCGSCGQAAAPVSYSAPVASSCGSCGSCGTYTSARVAPRVINRRRSCCNNSCAPVASSCGMNSCVSAPVNMGCGSCGMNSYAPMTTYAAAPMVSGCGCGSYSMAMPVSTGCGCSDCNAGSVPMMTEGVVVDGAAAPVPAEATDEAAEVEAGDNADTPPTPDDT